MAFDELKAKQSVMWGTGPYHNITETISDIHERVIARLEPRAGVTWLDVACGTGAVAERAAREGADVTGVDSRRFSSRPRRAGPRSRASISITASVTVRTSTFRTRRSMSRRRRVA